MKTDDIHTPPEPPALPRHRIFADGVLAGMSLTDAYLAAGYKCGRGSAGDAASKLAKRADVSGYIRAVQRRAAEESMLTHAEVRRFLARIVRTPLTDMDAEEGRNADLIKTVSRTATTMRLEKLDPLKAIELDLKLSGARPSTDPAARIARALESLPPSPPVPTDTLSSTNNK